ncbi:MAG: heavy-metal-associated domain-containing protein [Lutibacter sp.]|uniref:cation transporter n=1 Tax=Lutibacter sp. TaxID=1925666 RepID=UPI00184F6109|nr:heavy metal-associated domain-containing protein [Lutibacter sp.]MBT8318459.1 cation transporter [Lutibacter sp.]NNJ59317.1 heavy-metal-associated domain-containing protein [Lutibacter sp.]
MRIFSVYLVIVLAFISCTEVKKENTAKEPETIKQEVAAVYKNVEVEIEGMTCEIGCARLIESKLSKVEGISYSNVDFASKTGQFTYDTNKISKEDVSEKINAIAGGDLYKVVKSTEIEKITEKSE